MEYKKRIVGYHEYGKLIERLCKKIQISHDDISAVYGPPRGGLPIAVHVSHFFNCDLVLRLCDLYDYSLNGKYFVVVDDIIDTGKTMLELPFQLMYKYGSTGSLFLKRRSKWEPNFHIEIVPDEQWVVFPYEKVEEDPNR